MKPLLPPLYRLPGLLLIGMLLSGCWFFPDSAEETRPEQNTEQAAAQPKQRGTIVFEEPQEPSSGSAAENAEHPPVTPQKPVPDSRPRVAIIIDDMGYHREIGKNLLALDLELSFSFLPGSPFCTELETRAFEQGRDVLLHLPMEASDSRWDPGPGALMLSATPAQLSQTLKEDIAAVPHATGTNNHMGSKFTADRKAMHLVLGEVKHQGMFFVDSFTTAASTGMDEARKMGIKTNRRHIFLDNVQDPDKICTQLKKLTALAEKQHQAIGIGHPYQATLDALRGCGHRVLEQVHLVPVHELVQ